MKKDLVFGLMGCGEIAVQTAKSISQTPNCEIGMVQDVNEEVAKDLADKYNVPYCLTWEGLLADKRLDVIYVAIPHYLHVEAAFKSAAAGKHILIEKPIATTLSDTDRIIAAAEKAGVALSVCLPVRYTERTKAVKRLIADGGIGKIVGVDFGTYGFKPASYWSGGWTGRVKTDWRTKKSESGGGVFLMNLVHTVDLVRYVTGLEVKSVAAYYDTFRTNVDVEDYIVAIMRYDNGAIGASRGATIVEGKVPPGTAEGDRIIGLDGQIFTNLETVQLYVSKPYEGYAPGAWHTLPTGSPWGGREEFLAELAKAILAGRRPPVGGLDGRKSLEVCLAVYKSAETGQFVNLPMQE